MNKCILVISAHTLSLLATTDVKAVPGWSQGNTLWRKATAKSHALWNLQNRATVAANKIKEAAKRKLKTPVVVRYVGSLKRSCY